MAMRKPKPSDTPLAHWMQAHRLTDRELAERAQSVSRSQVCRIRQGRSTSMMTAARLAEVTGLPLEAFTPTQRAA